MANLYAFNGKIKGSHSDAIAIVDRSAGDTVVKLTVERGDQSQASAFIYMTKEEAATLAGWLLGQMDA